MGGNVQLTATVGTGLPDVAFGRYGYLISGTVLWSFANLLEPIGCAADATPPSCPMNLVAYGVTGTAATVAWIPSVEDATDIAYYEVYRNSPTDTPKEKLVTELYIPLAD